MDMYEVRYMFNGIEHTIDVPAVSEAEAAWKAGQHADTSAEFRSARRLASVNGQVVYA
jgi:hypothetical protein